MSERRVRIIVLAIESRPAGLAVAKCEALPDFYLVTKHDRLDEDIPDALQRFYRIRYGADIEVLPVEADDDQNLMQWAAIVARSQSGSSGIGQA
jgi:hypothetical protein